MAQPTRKVCALVDARAQECCERCGKHAEGGSRHHRRAKGMGGDKRPDTNLPANLVLLCGSGTTGCHGWVHANPRDAQLLGWIIPRWADPLEVPIPAYTSAWSALVFLDNDGNYIPAEEHQS